MEDVVAVDRLDEAETLRVLVLQLPEELALGAEGASDVVEERADPGLHAREANAAR
jgi:hypothetical protein